MYILGTLYLTIYEVPIVFSGFTADHPSCHGGQLTGRFFCGGPPLPPDTVITVSVFLSIFKGNLKIAKSARRNIGPGIAKTLIRQLILLGHLLQASTMSKKH